MGKVIRQHPTSVVLALYVFGFSIIILRISLTRAFNFDEFQALYAGAALARGKALYADQIGNHFPLVNIIYAVLTKTLGFHTSTVLAARFVSFLFLYLTLYFVFKIGALLWNRTAGLLAVAFAMATVVFVDKGIEIRHDAWNMGFHVMAAYWAARYVNEGKTYLGWTTGLFLGLALASTQKAVVWNLGIIVGICVCVLRAKNQPEFQKASLVQLLIAAALPLVVSLGCLFIFYDDTVQAFLKSAIGDASGYLSKEKSNEIYPFVYSRKTMVKALFIENGLLYLLALIGAVTAFLKGFRRGDPIVIIGSVSIAGILFYLLTNRPFLQSFLPTTPFLAILAAGWMVSFRNRWKKMNWMGSPLLSCGVLALVLAWPSYIIAVELPRNRSMTNQMKNISFCLVNLKFEEKVMCFSQQQVFFDPVFRFTRDRCGRSIHEMNPECFEKRMIDQQCRVVINDKRTRNLGPVIQEKIKRHFISARIGDILVPGMVIPPNGMVKERIWVSGPYYSPTRQLIINEKAIKKNIVILEKGEYVIKNMTRRPIHFSYVFKEKAKASSSGERNRSGR